MVVHTRQVTPALISTNLYHTLQTHKMSQNASLKQLLAMTRHTLDQRTTPEAPRTCMRLQCRLNYRAKHDADDDPSECQNDYE